LLRRLCELDKDRRYQTAGEVVKDLEVFMYSGGYGPTNERLSEYMHGLFPEVDKQRLLPEEVIRPR
ncbi:MAG: hypothetical protein QF464_07025, partial [Myxococcota bacterium]|nr:hypothetical protein [Myxococcota bacterium]